MKTAIIYSSVISLLFVLTGCASGGSSNSSPFVKRVDKLRPGTPQATVLEQLGPPDTKRGGIVTSPSPPGATENLLAAAPVGTPYKQWIYNRGDSHFHVFFARDQNRVGGWKVIQVRATE